MVTWLCQSRVRRAQRLIVCPFQLKWGKSGCDWTFLIHFVSIFVVRRCCTWFINYWLPAEIIKLFKMGVTKLVFAIWILLELYYVGVWKQLLIHVWRMHFTNTHVWYAFKITCLENIIYILIVTFQYLSRYFSKRRKSSDLISGSLRSSKKPISGLNSTNSHNMSLDDNSSSKDPLSSSLLKHSPPVSNNNSGKWSSCNWINVNIQLNRVNFVAMW